MVCHHCKCESIQRGNFAKYLFLGVWSLGKSYLFFVLTKLFRKPSWKIWSVLMVFFSLENLMCSKEILDKISWKIWSILIINLWNFWCVLVRFASSGKFTYVLVSFLALLENLMCSYKRIMSSPGKFICFVIKSKPPEKFDVF